jgi:hypothetical protein
MKSQVTWNRDKDRYHGRDLAIDGWELMDGSHRQKAPGE